MTRSSSQQPWAIQTFTQQINVAHQNRGIIREERRLNGAAAASNSSIHPNVTHCGR
jgi:hypothetical protein